MGLSAVFVNNQAEHALLTVLQPFQGCLHRMMSLEILAPTVISG